MARIQITDEFFPIVYMVAGDASAEEWTRAFADLERVYQRRQPFVALTDTSAARQLPSATVRRLIADGAKSMRPYVLAYSLGDVRVVTSSLIRGAHTAIAWLYAPPVPVKICASHSEAVDHCVALLRAAGVNPPSNLDVLRRRAG